MKVLLIILAIAAGIFIAQGLRKNASLDKAYNACIEKMEQSSPGTPLTSDDAKGYCGCLAEKAGEADNKAEAVQGIRPCYESHIAPKIIELCNQKRQETLASGWRLDCRCFASRLTDNFIEKEKTLNRAYSKEMQQKLVEESFRQCASR